MVRHVKGKEKEEGAEKGESTVPKEGCPTGARPYSNRLPKPRSRKGRRWGECMVPRNPRGTAPGMQSRERRTGKHRHTCQSVTRATRAQLLWIRVTLSPEEAGFGLGGCNQPNYFGKFIQSVVFVIYFYRDHNPRQTVSIWL